MVQERQESITMEATALYLEEAFTDRRIGSIRRLTPVTDLGDRDLTRPVLYVGQASVMTPMGTLPIAFEIEAETLAEAVAAYGPAAQAAIDETARELQEMRRQAASQLVIPDAGMAAGLKGGGKGPGGIQLP
jgi:hypothetical protein